MIATRLRSLVRRRSAESRDLLVLAALLVGVHAAATAATLAPAPRVNIALILVEGVLYALAVWRVLASSERVPLSLVLGVAGLMRLTVLGLDPIHSSDVFRYIWDGRVQGAGISPYLYIPNDPALAHLREEAIFPRMNRADYAPTIYPPLAQVLFFLTTGVSEAVIWMKAVLVGFEIVTMWTIIRLLDLERMPRERVLIYAWSPLAVWEFAGNGHLDAAMIAFVLLAVLAARRRRDALAGLALGAAVLVKLFPLALVPSLWRRWDWQLPAALAVALVIGYLPYALGAGVRVLGFLPAYLGEEGIRDGSAFWLTQFAGAVFGIELPSAVYLGAAGMVLAALAIGVTTRPESAERLLAGSLALAGAAMLALSPSYPWYFAWLLPFLCFVPFPPLLWLATASFVLYWDNQRAPWMADVLYGVTFALLGVALARRVRGRLPASERKLV